MSGNEDDNRDESHGEETSGRSRRFTTGAGVAIGAGGGVALSTAFDGSNLALWMVAGAALGLLIGAIVDSLTSNRNK